jgi:hypothetical protein
VSVLIVVESEFGNTLAIAEAIATGLGRPGEVEVRRPADAPAIIAAEVDLMLVGAPTHNLHAPTPASRRTAAGRDGYQGGEIGVVEWIAQLDPVEELRVVTFDTAVVGPFSGSASKALTKALRRRGFRQAHAGKSFQVGGTEGPLQDDALDQARQWGAELAAQS